MKEVLEKYGKLELDEALSKHTTYKIGGIAKYFLHPTSVDNFVEALKYLSKENISYFVIGNGSNLIIKDDYYDGVVIKCDLLKNFTIDEKNLILDAEAGVFLPALACKLVKMGYSGFEWAGGLPGTIGGSIYGNAESYKVSISDFLIDIKVFQNGEVKVLKKEDIKFEYRKSEFRKMKDTIILSARFKLEKKDKEELLELLQKRNKKRLAAQPLEFPSAGSVFRNPHIRDYGDVAEKYNLPVTDNGFISAGYLIESCGLKGKRIGGAMISEKHANFIINVDNAKAKDVIALMNLIKEKVEEKYGIKLKSEQLIIELSKEE
jgi:UDP-N-acetylmuramate dehydrogenase